MRHPLLAAAFGITLATFVSNGARAQIADVAPPQAVPEAPTPPPDVPPTPVLAELPPAPQGAFGGIGAPPTENLQLGAPMDPALAGRVLALLRRQNDTAAMTRMITGVVSLVATGVLLAVGMSQVDTGPDSELLFWTSIGMAPVLIAGGIASLSLRMPQEDRYERFKVAFADGMSPVEYAAVGGELLAESNFAHMQRVLGGAISIGLAGSGVVYLAVLSQMYSGSSGALGDLLDVFAYVFPVTLIVTGVLGAFLSFFVESQPEKDWHAFEAGVPPESFALEVRAAPYVTASGGGFAVIGQF